jgi:hypothetical protein
VDAACAAHPDRCCRTRAEINRAAINKRPPIIDPNYNRRALQLSEWQRLAEKYSTISAAFAEVRHEAVIDRELAAAPPIFAIALAS